MKKTALFLLTAASLLALASCDGAGVSSLIPSSGAEASSSLPEASSLEPIGSSAKTPEGSSSPADAEEGSSLSSAAVYEWPEELKGLMNDMIGEELPYIELLPGYQYEKVEEEDDDPYLYIWSDNDDTSLVQDYRDLLVVEDYVYYTNDDSYGYDAYIYTKVLVEGDEETASQTIYVQTDYFPGDDDFDPCFEIYAWMEVEEPAGPAITAWRTDDAALMNEHLGEELPLASFSESYTCAWKEDEDGGYLLLNDASVSSDVASAYLTTLQNASYEYYGTSYGWYVFYKDLSETSSLVVEVAYGSTSGMYIMAYLDVEEVPTIDYTPIEDWTEASKKLMTDFLGETLPVAPLSEEYTMTFEAATDEYVADLLIEDPNGNEATLSGWKDVLVAAKWDFDETLYENFGYYSFEKASSADATKKIEIEADAKTDGGIEAYVYLEEVPTAITAWSEADLALFQKVLGTQDIPVAPVSSAYELEESENYADTIELFDENGDADTKAAFDAVMSAAQGWEYDSIYESQGYSVYHHNLDETYRVSIQCYVYTYYGVAIGMYVFYYVEAIPATSASFPSEKIAAWIASEGIEGVSVPSYEAESYTYSDKSSSGYVMVTSPDAGTMGKDSIGEAYAAALKAAGWTVTYYSYSEYYFATLSSAPESFYLEFYTEDGTFQLFVCNDGE